MLTVSGENIRNSLMKFLDSQCLLEMQIFMPLLGLIRIEEA